MPRVPCTGMANKWITCPLVALHRAEGAWASSIGTCTMRHVLITHEEVQWQDSAFHEHVYAEASISANRAPWSWRKFEVRFTERWAPSFIWARVLFECAVHSALHDTASLLYHWRRLHIHIHCYGSLPGLGSSQMAFVEIHCNLRLCTPWHIDHIANADGLQGQKEAENNMMCPANHCFLAQLCTLDSTTKLANRK